MIIKINDTKYRGGGKRLDKFLAGLFSGLSRERIKNSIRSGNVKVNKRDVIKPSHTLKNNDLITGTINDQTNETKLVPENIRLDIIFENDDVLVINKPAGIVVHPGDGNETGTLANALIYHYPKIVYAIPDRGDDYLINLRPGIVHRLDKDTSGTMIVSKSKKSYDYLINQFKNRYVVKKYLAVCLGYPKKDVGIIENNIGRKTGNRKVMGEVGDSMGKRAITKYNVLQSFDHYDFQFSLIEFEIKTGRTHQIRVHAKESGFPILGDRVYFTKDSRSVSRKLNVDRQLLHSHTLSLFLSDKSKLRTFSAPIPDDMDSIIKSL